MNWRRNWITEPLSDVILTIQLRLGIRVECTNRCAIKDPESGQSGDGYLLPNSIHVGIYGRKSTDQSKDDAESRVVILQAVESYLLLKATHSS